jgi:hypothetical protein
MRVIIGLLVLIILAGLVGAFVLYYLDNLVMM